jgi:hypothetical protein
MDFAAPRLLCNNHEFFKEAQMFSSSRNSNALFAIVAVGFIGLANLLTMGAMVHDYRIGGEMACKALCSGSTAMAKLVR